MWIVKKHRVVSAVVGAALAMSVGAAAAWVVFTGLSGTGGGKFTTATGGVALTLTAETPSSSADYIQGPGQKGAIRASIVNNAGVPETIASVTADSIATTPAECASHLTFDSAAFMTQAANLGPIGTGGVDTTFPNTLVADSSLPSTCSDGTVTVTLSGTTTP